jgi:Leucine-rich repeat (LRR) protein
MSGMRLEYINATLLHNYLEANEPNYEYSQVESIFLMHNTISIIEPGTFDSFENLEYLNLRNNSLSELDHTLFNKFNMLEELDLSVNNLQFIHENLFNGLTSLINLDLSENQISEMHLNAFKSLELNLERLNLDQNKLSSEAYLALRNLKNLNYLNLMNQLSDPDKSFSSGDSDEIKDFLSKLASTSSKAFIRLLKV